MKRLLLFLLLFLFSLPFHNWTGLSIQEQKEREVQAKIAHLKREYPPNETGWQYEIGLKIKNDD
ncbi:MAG: hypothetical protein ACOC2U_00750 [bacterium]